MQPRVGNLSPNLQNCVCPGKIISDTKQSTTHECQFGQLRFSCVMRKWTEQFCTILYQLTSNSTFTTIRGCKKLQLQHANVAKFVFLWKSWIQIKKTNRNYKWNFTLNPLIFHTSQTKLFSLFTSVFHFTFGCKFKISSATPNRPFPLVNKTPTCKRDNAVTPNYFWIYIQV